MAINMNLENSDSNNQRHIELLHPKHRNIFADFIQRCKNAGFPVWITSSLRTYNQQVYLYNRWKNNPSKYSRAAVPGRSLHNFGLAIDMLIYDFDAQIFVRRREKYQQVLTIANSLGLRWLGSIMGDEIHHFDYNVYLVEDLVRLQKSNRIDLNGYVLLDEIGKRNPNVVTKTSENYSTEIGSDITFYETSEEEIPEKKQKRFVTDLEKMKANGIWQIVKLAADQYSLSQTINDATIANNQGSLFNFIQNVVQEPWLQFFGETIGNKYFFFTRKEPFDYNGFSSLPIIDNVRTDQVLSEDLSWYDGPIFSWYQIVPRGSFLGEQNLIFAYVTAVFFEEYADIWGSKPNAQVSNYINFTKFSGKSTLFQKALEDLRYMVESNAYLPFTRQGTIIIHGKSDIKRGYRLRYLPTNEIFYVESVSHKYNISDEGNVDYTTVLRLSRGMKLEYTISPKDKTTKSYFNIISFENQPPKTITQTVEVPAVRGELTVFFDNDRSYLIDLEEKFSNSGVDAKMFQQIELYPNLRTELKKSNDKMIKVMASLVEKNPKAKSFRCIGFIDSDDISGSAAKRLSDKRANLLKTLVIEEYLKNYKTLSRTELNEKIKAFVNYSGEVYQALVLNENNEFVQPTVDEDLKRKAYSRYADFQMEPYSYEDSKQVESNEMGWHVNREVFQFFLNRLQNG